MLADDEQKLTLLQEHSSSSLGRTVTKTPLESRLVTYFCIPVYTQ